MGEEKYGYITPTFVGPAQWKKIYMATWPIMARQVFHSWVPISDKRSILPQYRKLLEVPMFRTNQHSLIMPGF